MTGWARNGLVLAIGLVLGIAGGGYAGLRVGTDSMASRWIEAEARYSEEVVDVLEQLRSGRTDEGVARLETHLNRHAFGLMPSARAGIHMSDRAGKRVSAATRRVRAYREKFPHQGETALDRDVRRYLDRQ